MRQAFLTAALLVGLLAAAFWGYNAMFSPREDVSLEVESLKGQVSFNAGTTQAWTDLSQGQKLEEGARLKTGGEGSALTMRTGDGDTMFLASESELVVTDLSEDGASFELSYGQVRATVTQFHERQVKVKTPGSSMTVSTQKGDFTLTHDGFGAFEVRSLDGDVKVGDGQGQAVELKAGTAIAVDKTGRVSDSIAIDNSVLLNVEWPASAPPGEVVTVSGKTRPGSEVMVGGARTQVDPSGKFKAEVQVKEGSEVEVRARNGAGTTSDRADLVLKEPTPPPPTPRPPPEPVQEPPKLNVTTQGDWR